MKPILVGLDGSELAERGLSLATELAKGLDDKVIAARVVPPTWSAGGYDPELRQRLEVADEAAAAGYLAKVADRLRADSVKAETRLLHGDAWRALLAAAHQDDCGLIVLTSHGLSGLASRVFGSVAQKVLANASCPVVVVPCSDADLAREEELEERASDEQAVQRMSAVAKAKQR